MDPITMAIVSALSAGALSSTSEVAKQAIGDIYYGLKELLKKKYGEKNDLNDAIDKLEKKPESDARQKIVEEEVEIVGAHKDFEILEFANLLMKQLKSQTINEINIQIATGSNIVQADRGGKASLRITGAKKNNHD